jgi:hypothetical protein
MPGCWSHVSLAGPRKSSTAVTILDIVFFFFADYLLGLIIILYSWPSSSSESIHGEGLSESTTTSSSPLLVFTLV